MARPLSPHWPLLLAVTFYLALTALVGWRGVAASQGHFTYGLDDAYIHLAMARHQLDDGVWGVTRYEWSSSSSSPLWGTMLVGMGALTGTLEYWPLWLNLTAGVGLLLLLDHAARTVGGVGARLRALGLLLFVIAVPLPYNVLLGMEHLWQGLLTLAFVHLALLHTLRREQRWQQVALLALAPLLAMIRFEGLIVVAMGSALLLWQRRWPLAVAVALLGVLPVALYAWISLGHGWYALPNSALLKRSQVSLTNLAGTYQNSWFLLLLFSSSLGRKAKALIFYSYFALLLVALLERRPLRSHGQLALILTGTLALIQGFFGRGDVRYEVALVTLFAYALLVQPWLRERPTGRGWLRLGTVVLASAMLLARGVHTLPKTGSAMADIYNQQGQMGRFLARYYTGAPVAANDIGYINYAADIRCLDMVGLASMDTARLILARETSAEAFQQISDAHNVRIAMVYDRWFLTRRRGVTENLLPPDWILVAKWTLPTVTIAADRTVSFYATSEAEAAQLAANLRAFEPQLPPIVTASYEAAP